MKMDLSMNGLNLILVIYLYPLLLVRQMTDMFAYTPTDSHRLIGRVAYILVIQIVSAAQVIFLGIYPYTNSVQG